MTLYAFAVRCAQAGLIAMGAYVVLLLIGFYGALLGDVQSPANHHNAPSVAKVL